MLRCSLACQQGQQHTLAAARCLAAGRVAALLRQCHSELELCGPTNAQAAKHSPRGHCHLCEAAWRQHHRCLCGSAWLHAARCCRRCGCRPGCAPGRLPVHILRANECRTIQEW